MTTAKEIMESIENHRETYIHASLRLWDLAEPPFEEHESAKLQADILRRNGFTVEMGVADLPTAFVASWGAGEPVVGYMGEYDALPGLSQQADTTQRVPVKEGAPGHGCGHHILGTAAMAAAIANKEYLEREGGPGTVRYYGCPAEEGGGGKVLMAQAGLFDDCAAAISWHATDDNGIWSINFHAQQSVAFTFKGKAEDGLIARHTGPKTQTGASALEALELFNMGAHMIRHHLDSSYTIRTSITGTGDGDPYQVPRESGVRYWVRAHTADQVRFALDRLWDCARGAAIATGCTVSAQYYTGYCEMLPNRALERIMHQAFSQVGTVPMTQADWDWAERMHTALPEDCEGPTFDLIRFLYEEQAEPVIERIKGKPYNDLLYPYREINKHKPGSTDICDVSWTTPTTQCVVACYVKDTLGHSWQEVAQGRSDICMKGMLVAAKVMALTGVQLFADPAALAAVRREFEEKRPQHNYQPLLRRVREE